MKIAVRGGRVYDPLNGADGEIRTICVEGGRIVPEPPGGFAEEKTIDARGRAVFPGGVDMHCHVAGPAVNRARRLVTTRRVSETAGDGRELPFPLVPPCRTTGQRYSLLGYTTVIDAAISPTGSRQCHMELAQTPSLDRGFLLLLANHEFLLQLLERGEKEAAREVVAHLLGRTGAFGIKAVNPGGLAQWKAAGTGPPRFSEPLPGRRVSPRDIVQFLAEAAQDLVLPHPLHIHCNSLGVAGNIDVTLETSRALEGRRHHLTHVQFHAYGKDERDNLTSAARRLMEHFHSSTELTMDVGQVMFGEALTLSADQELENRLWKLTGNPYVNVDVELETGCGIVPVEYRSRSRLHALQWAAGMEIFLLCEDPWRLALSTDHPNGASFLTYPALIAQLMDRNVRRRALSAANSSALAGSPLHEIEREYTLSEIAILTRAAPACILGLPNKGHLGPGADADITIYDDCPDREVMFRWPLVVLKGGEILVDDGERRATVAGATLRVEPETDPTGRRLFEEWFRRYGSYDPAQLGPGGDLLRETVVVQRRNGG